MKRGRGAQVHVYVLEHIVSLNYRIAWWIFTKLGRDKVLMTPHICIDSWAKSAQSWIQGGAKIGPGGSLLQRTSSSDRKATATNRMHSSDLEAFGKKYCYFWFHWEILLFHYGIADVRVWTTITLNTLASRILFFEINRTLFRTF